MDEYQAKRDALGMDVKNTLKGQAVMKMFETNLRKELQTAKSTMRQSVEHVKEMLLDFLCQVSMKLYENNKCSHENLEAHLPSRNDILNLDTTFLAKFDEDVDRIMRKIWYVWHDSNKHRGSNVDGYDDTDNEYATHT